MRKFSAIFLFICVLFTSSIYFSFESVDSPIPVWSSGTNIPIPIRGGNMASYSKDNNGYLFIASGRNQNEAIIKTLQRYNVNANTWDTLSPHPTGLLGAATTILNDDLYLIGGVVNPPGAGQSTVYKYSIENNTWTQAANFPIATGDSKAVSYQDSLIYVAGGYTGPNTGIVYLYNSISNTWRAADFMPTNTRRNFGGFAITGDTLVYMCGTAAFGSSLYYDSVYVGVISQTDRADITWTRGANFPGQTRTFFDANNWGSRGIITTGGSTDNTFNTYSAECYTFSPGRNEWTRLPDKPTAWLTGQSGTVKLPGNIWKLVCAGGYNTTYLNQTEILSDTLSPVGIKVNSEIPVGFTLKQNYPNPFNPQTVINFSLIEAGFVSLKVYDVLGNEVNRLVNERLSAGSFSVNFDAQDLSAGIYFYELSVNDNIDVKKMMFLK